MDRRGGAFDLPLLLLPVLLSAGTEIDTRFLLAPDDDMILIYLLISDYQFGYLLTVAYIFEMHDICGPICAEILLYDSSRD
jgi:hypothetical protein